MGLIFPPAYLFKKSKVLGQRYTCAILSLVLFVFLIVASTLMWMLEDKLTSFVDNEEVVIDPMVTGSRYYDSNSKTVLDLTDDRNFVLYLDHNEPSEIKVEGKYRVYKGEAAIDKIVSIKEIDTTREKLEEMIDQLTSVTYYDKPGTEPYKAKRENFYTFIFDIESNKNRDGSTNESNVKQGLYIGFYIDELDAFEMVNLVTQNNYRWVRQ